MRTQMHQDAFPGEDISDRPPPEASVPGLLRADRRAPARAAATVPPTCPRRGGGMRHRRRSPSASSTSRCRPSSSPTARRGRRSTPRRRADARRRAVHGRLAHARAADLARLPAPPATSSWSTPRRRSRPPIARRRRLRGRPPVDATSAATRWVVEVRRPCGVGTPPAPGRPRDGIRAGRRAGATPLPVLLGADAGGPPGSGRPTC